MKRTFLITLLIGLSTIYSRAYSAPSCTNFLQPKQTQTAQEIIASIPEVEKPIQTIINEESLTLEYPLSFGFGLFRKEATLKVRIFSNQRIDFILTPKNLKDLDFFQKKSESLYQEMLSVFNHKQSFESDTNGPGVLKDPSSDSLIVYTSMTGVSSKKIDMASFFIRRLLKLKAQPKMEYWKLEGSDFDGSIYYIPDFLKDHQPPVISGQSFKKPAPFYSRPSNLPYAIQDFFTTRPNFKLILNSQEWIIEGVFIDSDGNEKTLMLSVSPDKVTVLDHTPYQTGTPVDYSDNLHSWIKDNSFNTYYGEDADVVFGVDTLIPFLDELERSGFELTSPPVNTNIFPFYPNPSK